MDTITLGNRPTDIPANSKLLDFKSGDTYIRVSLRLIPTVDTGMLLLDAQAFEVDANGHFRACPDGRPSRTPSTQHTVSTSALSDTYTLAPGWVRDTGTYTPEDYGPDAVHGNGKPSAATDNTQPYFDDDTGAGYRWDEGETVRIAKGKADDLLRIIANSPALMGTSF